MMKMQMLAAALLLATLPGITTAGEGQSGLRIAVVNISRVFNEYKKTASLNETMKQKFQDRKKALEQERQKLLERAQKLRSDTRPADDPEVLKERQQLGIDNMVLQKKFEKLQQEIAAFNLKHTSEIMADIEAAVKRLASKRGYDLVLKYQPPQEEARSNLELMQQIGANPVLFFSRTLDITGTVIELLNAAYERGISLVEKAPPPAGK